MADFITVKATHTFIMQNEAAHQQIVHFLEHGTFNHNLTESQPGSSGEEGLAGGGD